MTWKVSVPEPELREDAVSSFHLALTIDEHPRPPRWAIPANTGHPCDARSGITFVAVAAAKAGAQVSHLSVRPCRPQRGPMSRDQLPESRQLLRRRREVLQLQRIGTDPIQLFVARR